MCAIDGRRDGSRVGWVAVEQAVPDQDAAGLATAGGGANGLMLQILRHFMATLPNKA